MHLGHARYQKFGVACKNDSELMAKIWKLKGYCPECYNHSLEALHACIRCQQINNLQKLGGRKSQ